jgi:hypothetical protein
MRRRGFGQRGRAGLAEIFHADKLNIKT